MVYKQLIFLFYVLLKGELFYICLTESKILTAIDSSSGYIELQADTHNGILFLPH